MRPLACALAMVMSFGALSTAGASERTGKIMSIDWDKNTLTLENGSRYVAKNRDVEVFAFTVGEKVTVIYHKRDGKRIVTSIRPAP